MNLILNNQILFLCLLNTLFYINIVRSEIQCNYYSLSSCKVGQYCKGSDEINQAWLTGTCNSCPGSSANSYFYIYHQGLSDGYIGKEVSQTSYWCKGALFNTPVWCLFAYAGFMLLSLVFTIFYCNSTIMQILCLFIFPLEEVLLTYEYIAASTLFYNKGLFISAIEYYFGQVLIFASYLNYKGYYPTNNTSAYQSIKKYYITLSSMSQYLPPSENGFMSYVLRSFLIIPFFVVVLINNIFISIAFIVTRPLIVLIFLYGSLLFSTKQICYTGILNMWLKLWTLQDVSTADPSNSLASKYSQVVSADATSVQERQAEIINFSSEDSNRFRTIDKDVYNLLSCISLFTLTIPSIVIQIFNTILVNQAPPIFFASITVLLLSFSINFYKFIKYYVFLGLKFHKIPLSPFASDSTLKGVSLQGNQPDGERNILHRLIMNQSINSQENIPQSVVKLSNVKRVDRKDISSDIISNDTEWYSMPSPFDTSESQFGIESLEISLENADVIV